MHPTSKIFEALGEFFASDRQAEQAKFPLFLHVVLWTVS